LKKGILVITGIAVIISIIFGYKHFHRVPVTKADDQSVQPVTVDWVNSQIKERTDKLAAMADKVNQMTNAVNAMSGQTVFKDVPDGYFAKEHILYLAGKGIISGYPDEQKFYPGNYVTRYQAAAMMIKAKQLTLVDKPSTFKDISNDPKNDDVRKVAMTALQYNIMHGKPQPDGSVKFDPWSPVTRAQMAVILSNAFDFSGQQTYPYTPFPDVPEYTWGNQKYFAYDGIKELVTHHIAKGKENGTFDPEGKTTRAQFCVFLSAAIDTKYRY
jgi:hypothetical protein